MDARPEIVTLSIAELEADPHGVFRRYRPITPLIARDGAGYVVIRSNDVQQLMRDPRLRQGETDYVEMRGVPNGAIFDLFKYGMLTSNGAVHRRRRSPFSRTFAARLIADLRQHIRSVADGLVESWYAGGAGEVDLVDDYAALIPARAISGLLGLPSEDIPRFTTLVYSTSRILSFTFTPDEFPHIEAAARELTDYVEEMLRVRRETPANDFLARYVTDAELKGQLSAIEIIVQILTLIVGATDTTRVAAASQVALLLRHREQWDAVCRDPSLIPGAVSEAMRYEPSVAGVSRISLEDVELDGHILPGGQFVSLSTMSAMRDETAYAQPDTFDIYRTDLPRSHLIFGGGPHRCIGEALAWVELEEGLGALAARIPGLRLAEEPPAVQGHYGIRRIAHMRVALPH